jgi:trimethylamine--corrinoid protein Co-methyltransferase
VTVDDTTLALDAFREVGPGNHFFGCAHTMANYETAFWDSELSDNNTFEQWSEAGGEDSMIRANKRWKRILAEVEDPPIDPAVDEALLDFVARRKGSMPDAWY